MRMPRSDALQRAAIASAVCLPSPMAVNTSTSTAALQGFGFLISVRRLEKQLWGGRRDSPDFQTRSDLRDIQFAKAVNHNVGVHLQTEIVNLRDTSCPWWLMICPTSVKQTTSIMPAL